MAHTKLIAKDGFQLGSYLAKPYKSAGLHAPVNVIGMFGTASQSTQLADISYALSADIIKPYGN